MICSTQINDGDSFILCFSGANWSPLERLYVNNRVDDIFSLLNSDKQTIYRNCEADAITVLRRTSSSSEVAIGAARFPVATEISTMRWKPIQSKESALYWYYWFTIERMDEFFHKGRQRENLRFQPGDESRLGRPLL